jgi:PTH1 family peptidyl-tRNA hydrolase
VGLGNPGPGYAKSRHNVGFWFLDRIAQAHHIDFRENGKFHGHAARITVNGRECGLLKPMTFMNRSGQSVSAYAQFYRIPHPAILVVHDELDLPPGAARLKLGGGHGGHNGLRDLLTQLGDGDFARLRLGIGHPGARELVTPYVLGNPSPEDRGAIESAIDASLEFLPDILAGEFAKVMNLLHRREI